MGYIIVVEGTDGSGKKTQVDRLYSRLIDEGYNVLRQSFPNYDSPACMPVKMYLNGEFGESANSLDGYQASVLYTVDRLCTYNKDLKEHYENGGILLFDRYVQSNMIHQACKIEDENEVDKYLEWLDNLEFNLLKLPRANKVIFLDMPVEYSIKLARSRGEYKSDTKKDVHEMDDTHLYKAYNRGKKVCNKYNWININCVENDNIKSIDEIHNEIYNDIIKDLRCL